MRFKLDRWEVAARARPTPGILVTFAVRFQDGNLDRYADRLRLVQVHPRVVVRAGAGAEPVDARVVEFLTTPVVPDGGELPVSLLLDTPFDLLERLEVARGGQGGITIQVTPRLTVALAPATASHELLPFFVHSNFLENASFDLSRDDWLKLLGEMSFRDVLVVEVPRPLHSGSAPAGFLRAREKMEEARRSFDEHRYDHVLADVQMAMEHLAPTGAGGTWTRLVQHHLANAEEPVRERLERTLVSASRLIHLGRHAGETELERRTHVSRPHAAYLLGMGTLVLGWCLAETPSPSPLP